MKIYSGVLRIAILDCNNIPRIYTIKTDDIQSKLEKYLDEESGLIMIDKARKLFVLKVDKEYWKDKQLEIQKDDSGTNYIIKEKVVTDRCLKMKS